MRNHKKENDEGDEEIKEKIRGRGGKHESDSSHPSSFHFELCSAKDTVSGKVNT